MKKIVVLGITGSIGASTVEIVKNHPDKFTIICASANKDLNALEKVRDEMHIQEIYLTGKNIDHHDKSSGVHFGEKELIERLKTLDYDILLNAVSGSAGLKYTISAAQRGKDIALANKESLVMAGELINRIIIATGSKILPVDSEHSALFQLLEKTPKEYVRHVHLTASGGPFRKMSAADLKNVSIADALAHPTWSMGKKISIDSATMFNKGLEVIEAHHLFQLPYDQIKTVIHPQSVIHSFVEFRDGSFIAQLSNPSMQLPILYALSYPEHIDSDCVKTSLSLLPSLTFEEIDQEKYPMLDIAYSAGKTSGLMPTILNAANEAAVELFLQGKIAFNDIYRLVSLVYYKEKNIKNPDLETILLCNEEIYKKTLTGYPKLI